MSTEAPAVSTETAKPAALDTSKALETTTAEKPAEAPAPRTYTQEEMDRITAKVKKNAAYRARKETEARLAGLREGMAIARPAEPRQAPIEEKAPERQNFQTTEEYLDAKADYVGRKAAREEREKMEKEESSRREKETKEKTLQDFQSKVREKFPDIEDRLADIGHINIPQGMDDAIAESPLGPEILSFLADNHKECERIAALRPAAAIREIGKLEERLEAKQKAAATPPPAPKAAEKAEAEEKAEPEPKAKPSKAPEPINPVGGKAMDINAEPSLDKNGGKDWINWRNRQELARRTGIKN